MSKKKVLLRGVFINRDTNGEGVLKVGTTLIRVSTVMGILYIYYVSVTDYKGIATSFKVGKLVEIVNKSSVILEDRKGKQFKCAVKKLHKTADKAVQTKKGKQLAKQYMAELKQKEEESLVDKKIQSRIK